MTDFDRSKIHRGAAPATREAGVPKGREAEMDDLAETARERDKIVKEAKRGKKVKPVRMGLYIRPDQQRSLARLEAQTGKAASHHTRIALDRYFADMKSKINGSAVNGVAHDEEGGEE